MAPLRALIPDFAALLAMPTDAATTTRIERGPRPLGSPECDRDARAPARPPLGTPQTQPKAARERDTAQQAQLL